jgi:aminopeptidase YwaD
MYEKRAKSAMEFTAKLIREYGPRLTGSVSCGKAADAIRDKASACCDKVSIETFPVHPGAFLGFIKVLVVFYIASAAGLSFAPIFSAALMTVGITILVFGFFLYRELLDPFYPEFVGRNVVGVIEPEGEVKRQVIVSGHHDSARVFNFYVDRPELYSRRIYGGIGSVVVLWLASLVIFVASGPLFGVTLLGFGSARLIFALLFVCALPLVLPLWKFAGNEGTPGAGDNLVASAIALEIVEEFSSRRRRASAPGASPAQTAGDAEPLAHTRVVFASFDAEEAGLRGARAFARGRRAEFAGLPSYGYNMDCVYSFKDIRFLESDLNGSVKLDREETARLARIAESEGFPSKTQPIAFLTGGTDAAELASAGVKQTSLLAMRWGNDDRSSVYHTPSDTIDAVDPLAVEAAIRLGVRYIECLDAERQMA